MRSTSVELKELHKGLRVSQRNPTNSVSLVVSKGCAPREGVLSTLDQLQQLDTSVLGEVSFPFPQMFVCLSALIVCTQTEIFELLSGTLTSKLSGITPGSTWELVDFYDFIYLTNGIVAVTRDPATHVYAVSSTLPYGSAVCNYNGQVMIGGPEVNVPQNGLL